MTAKCPTMPQRARPYLSVPDRTGLSTTDLYALAPLNTPRRGKPVGGLLDRTKRADEAPRDVATMGH